MRLWGGFGCGCGRSEVRDWDLFVVFFMKRKLEGGFGKKRREASIVPAVFWIFHFLFFFPYLFLCQGNPYHFPIQFELLCD